MQWFWTGAAGELPPRHVGGRCEYQEAHDPGVAAFSTVESPSQASERSETEAHAPQDARARRGVAVNVLVLLVQDVGCLPARAVAFGRAFVPFTVAGRRKLRTSSPRHDADRRPQARSTRTAWRRTKKIPKPARRVWGFPVHPQTINHDAPRSVPRGRGNGSSSSRRQVFRLSDRPTGHVFPSRSGRKVASCGSRLR